eukprot:COSAG05_NODE_16432_length_346_cov_0.829960_2_plen_65_part_01
MDYCDSPEYRPPPLEASLKRANTGGSGASSRAPDQQTDASVELWTHRAGTALSAGLNDHSRQFPV